MIEASTPGGFSIVLPWTIVRHYFCSMAGNTRNKPKDIEALQEYFDGSKEEEELTYHQREKLARIRTAHAGLLSFKSNFSILGNLMKTFDISHAQAYRDINDTQFIFGNFRKSNKEVKRHIAEEMALETYRTAQYMGDTKGMAAATRNYIDATGISVNDPDIPDFEKLQPSVYPIVIAKELEGMIEKLLASPGSVNLSKFYNQQAENAEYEELPKPTDQDGDSKAT